MFVGKGIGRGLFGKQKVYISVVYCHRERGGKNGAESRMCGEIVRKRGTWMG